MRERTVKEKIVGGFNKCNWDIIDTIGLGNLIEKPEGKSIYPYGGASWHEVLKPLMEYLEKDRDKAIKKAIQEFIKVYITWEI